MDNGIYAHTSAKHHRVYVDLERISAYAESIWPALIDKFYTIRILTYITANDPCPFSRPAVVLSQMSAVKKRGLITNAVHIVHRKDARY